MAILIPACTSPSLAFHMMYSAYNLNKQSDNIQPGRTAYLEPVHCSMSGSNFRFLTCRLISQEAGTVVWYLHYFKHFPQFAVIDTVKGFHIVYKAEVDVSLELSGIFYDPMDVGKLISDFFAFSKSTLNIWEFMIHILLKTHLENCEH